MPLHVPLPEELRALRRKLGLTQAQVAKAAGVSQPLVARIENGTVDARLSTFRSVVEALNRAEHQEVTLRDVMTAPVTSVRASDSVGVAIRVMREHNFSQMPVLQKGAPVGSLSDRSILHALSEARDADELARMPVAAIMGPSFPMAPPEMSVEQAIRLLEDQAAILVLERGRLVGIVSKADLLSLVR